MRKTVSYYYQAPFGGLNISVCNGKIVSLAASETIQENDNNKPEPLIQQCINQLDEYFEGKRTEFSIPLNPSGTYFQKSVWKHVSQIGCGKTKTYGQIATECGDFKKNRAVGMANGKNPIMLLIPCHRVIGADGSLTGYAGGLVMKKWLLDHEQKTSGSFQQSLF